MAPSIPSAKLTLSCPLFAADFDPRNPDFLLVAGGGGESRSGTLLDTSKRHEISEVVDIELSRDEDSVTSLATAHASDDSIIALAGINSSIAEQERGNNAHLRSFQIDYPPRRQLGAASADEGASTEKEIQAAALRQQRKTSALSRVPLFRTKPGATGTYQRITRLSPWRNAESPRVAAITTGLAPSGEIVFFNASTTTPNASDVIGRIRLDSDEEAEDVDIIRSPADGKFLVAYTNGVKVFTCQISPDVRSNASPDVACVYTTPLPEKTPKTRPKFRALRFISPTTLALLQNAPDRQGCELVLLDLRPTASFPKSSASVVRRKKLRRAMKIGLGLDVCRLGTKPETQQQVAIAVAGSDLSIEVLTLESNPEGGHGKLRPYTTLREVHPFSMTKICFSPFSPPPQPVTPETPPQYIKLASISLGNTVVVHTFPLSPSPPSSRTPRYVLVMPYDVDAWTSLSSGLVALFSIMAVCFLVLAFTEIRGVMPPYLGVTEWLPPDVREPFVRPYNTPPPGQQSALVSSAVPTMEVLFQKQSLRDFLRARSASTADDTGNSILVRWSSDRNEPFIYTVSTSQLGGAPRRWEDLPEQDRLLWTQRLSDSGHEIAGDDETLLQDLLFETED
ncbi:hypothetical protein EYZ11_007886 [Aspergillus tanneri]|uniref:Guanine nucleotide-exchange factor SEC12 n=1 Tax=Aspergillus tanneri TaxID=1220188 RepID=A0A4S3JBU4_9EURO|nr:uncharacterized protein ATNIH1004_009900 [Aspergillus tanneri]KAA8643138.1 hypothetical protein ATNIH1004_009900 [Aspergillus tanneri]THC92629.1 hypothetical protein EYZ11_007886 [Aspergillus tanneri]